MKLSPSHLWLLAGLSWFASLVACSGNGNSTPSLPARETSATLSFSSTGSAVDLPTVGGMTSTITLYPNSAPNGATLTVTVSNNLPEGSSIPARDASAMASFTLESSSTVTMSAVPKVTASMSAAPQKAGTFYVWEFDANAMSWNDVGPLAVSGTQFSFGGSGKSFILKAGIRYVLVPFSAAPLQFCPTPPPPTPTPAPTSKPLGLLPCMSSGATAVGILCYNDHAYAFVPKGISGSSTISQVQVDASSPPRHFTASFKPMYCAGDQSDLKVFCAASTSNRIAVIDPIAGTESEFTTIAGGTLVFSDRSCTICGLVFDPSDRAIIVAESRSGSIAGVFDLYSTASHQLVKTIAPPNGVGESFGYDYNRNFIFSSYDAGQTSAGRRADLINVLASAIYSFADEFGGPIGSTVGTPSPLDSNAMDAATGLGYTVEESRPIVYIANIFRGGHFNVLPPPGTVHVPTATNMLTSTTLKATCATSPLSAIAIESTTHSSAVQSIMMTSSENCAHGPVGAISVPGSPGAPGGLTDYVFAQVPDVGGCSRFVSGEDPHDVAAFDGPACPHCGILVNADQSYLVVVDLSALLNVPRMAGDVHSADPTFDLVSHHVLTYHNTF